MIELRGITKHYGHADAQFTILNNVSLAIEQGELLSIMGPSGSGKTTLMNILGLLTQIDRGEYFLDGYRISQMSDNEKARFRNEYFGFIFQSFNLLKQLTCLENVALPLQYAKEKHVNVNMLSKKVLERVGLGDRIFHKPHELSGGQQQRVAIARALINQPKFILADEPTGALDEKTSNDIMALLVELNRESDTTIVIVTHAADIAKRCDRNLFVRDGQFVSGSFE